MLSTHAEHWEVINDCSFKFSVLLDRIRLRANIWFFYDTHAKKTRRLVSHEPLASSNLAVFSGIPAKFAKQAITSYYMYSWVTSFCQSASVRENTLTSPAVRDGADWPRVWLLMRMRLFASPGCCCQASWLTPLCMLLDRGRSCFPNTHTRWGSSLS